MDVSGNLLNGCILARFGGHIREFNSQLLPECICSPPTLSPPFSQPAPPSPNSAAASSSPALSTHAPPPASPTTPSPPPSPPAYPPPASATTPSGPSPTPSPVTPSSSSIPCRALPPSFPFVLKAVVRLSSLPAGLQVHCQSVTGALASDVRVAAAPVEMYSKLGSASDARKVFDETPFRDILLWNAMVAAHARSGDIDAACDVFAGMPEKNVISWTVVIAGYASKGLSVEALVAFRKMLAEGVRPDQPAMLAALSACADMGALELGKWIHGCIAEYKLCTTVPLSNALINMYAKSGYIQKALDLFEGMEQRSVVTWTAMIDGLAQHGMCRDALVMFSRMVRAGVKPNAVTFVAVLSA